MRHWLVYVSFILLLQTSAYATKIIKSTITTSGDYLAGDQISVATRVPNVASNSSGAVSAATIGMVLPALSKNPLLHIMFFGKEPKGISNDNEHLNIPTNELVSSVESFGRYGASGVSSLGTDASVYTNPEVGLRVAPIKFSENSAKDVWFVLSTRDNISLGNSTVTLIFAFDDLGEYQ